MLQIYWAFGLEDGALAGSTKPDSVNVKDAVRVQKQPDQFWSAGEVKKQLGEIGDWLLDGLQSRIDSGKFGEWGIQQKDRGGNRRGVTIVKAGAANQVLAAAKDIHSDLLLAARIEVKPLPGGKASATLTLRVVDVLGGVELWKSQPLSSTAFASAHGQGDNPASKLVDGTFAFIDESIVLKKFPILKPETVQKRAEKLAASETTDPITALTELRYYQVKSLLTVDEIRPLYEKFLNTEAAGKFASDDLPTRRMALSSLLPGD